MTFSWVGDGDSQYTTSGTQSTSLGYGTAGDVLIAWASGRGESNDAAYTPDGSGWSELGSVIRCDYTAGPFGNRYGSFQAWWKVLDGTETTLTIYRSGGSRHRIGFAVYTSDSGETPAIIGAVADDTTGSTNVATYTPPDFTAVSNVRVVSFIFIHTDVSGYLSVPTPRGFSSSTQAADPPAGILVDKACAPGSVSMPSISAGGASRPWTSKTLALAAELPPGTDGWSVGFLKF